MAFDRPIEADSVDDLGLISSLIRAPVLGIMWLLGGEHSKEEEKETVKNEQMDRELSGHSDGGDERGAADRVDDNHVGSSNSGKGRGKTDICNHDPPGGPSSSTSSKPINQAEINGIDKENKENWPSVGFLDSDEDAPKCKSEQQPRSSRQTSRREDRSNAIAIDPATEMIDDLVAVMASSHIGNQTSSGSPGPATSAVLTSQSKITASSSTNSLAASYSASTFSNHQTSQPLSLHSSTNNGAHPSQTFNQNSNSNSITQGKKKTSWSDEGGNRSLVEYSDEPAVPPQSKHWSSMRRNSYRASRHSFDGGFDGGDKGTGTRRSEVRVIKSALKRSGSYSPPVALYANNARGLSSSTSFSTESSPCSSSPGMKSFRSISVIGSSDSSKSTSSDHLSKESAHSLDTDDSMAAVTNKKLNSNEVQCVPSTLQVGCGRASGGLIMPRGDPRYYFPRGGANDPRYQLILGTGVPSAYGQQADENEQEEKGEKSVHDASNARSAGTPNPATAMTSGGSSPGRHHFLPRHTNGFISPQYGFFVNITPPTPELYAKAGDKSSRHAAMQQQSYQQFYQNKYPAPSPIPEGYPGVSQGIPQRYVGRSSVSRPSANRSSGERDQLSTARQNSLKPTFTKNKKGMGMILAENPHHGVWPTVPFG